jgi:hypothetical protein
MAGQDATSCGQNAEFSIRQFGRRFASALPPGRAVIVVARKAAPDGDH